MPKRVLVAGLVAIASVEIAGPAWAKANIAEANIVGPGIETALRIEPPDTYGLWDSGIDVTGGLDDVRADSVEALGLSPADLGPRYIVTYRFGHGRASSDLIRQDLYPYAQAGPVTHTPPGQELTGQHDLAITAGWYQSSLGFLQYLVDRGLPVTNPVASVAARHPAPDTGAALHTVSWIPFVVVLVALVATSLAALAVRRRVLTEAGATRRTARTEG